MPVFAALTSWPRDELSFVGKLTRAFIGNTGDHVGLTFTECTEAQVQMHSVPCVSHESARGNVDVSFDFMSDLKPRFQSLSNPKYFTQRSSSTWYKLDVDQARLHRLAVQVANECPENKLWYRCTFCCPFLPCACCSCFNRSSGIAPSTCAALSMRIVAAEVAGSEAPLFDDAAAKAALNLPNRPKTLAAYAPLAACEALRRAGVACEGIERV